MKDAAQIWAASLPQLLPLSKNDVNWITIAMITYKNLSQLDKNYPVKITLL